MQQKAFDNYAESYDEHFTRSAIGQLQRQRVYTFLKQALDQLPASAQVLELNCGTGVDALWMAKKGFSVQATDLSEGMIRVAERKKNIRQLSNLNFTACPFDQLNQQFPDKKFRLVFSNFGGLNCVNAESIRKLSTDLAALLEPGGTCCAVVMGRKCGWERFYFRKKKEPVKAMRRMQQGGVETMLGGERFLTWYYSPSEFVSCFSAFELIKVRPVGLLIPPSYLENYFSKKKLLLKSLNSAERMIGNLSLFADRADHYYIELKKK
jgi:ubiquinone/menaquinone biosynthesis C-methylase UbiE